MESESSTAAPDNTKKDKFITFTDLYRIKHVGLIKLIEDYGAVYLVSRTTPPLRITMAKLG